MAKPTCQTCTWFDSEPCTSYEGKCKASSPIAVLVPHSMTHECKTVWPKVHFQDFCGQHKPREEGGE